MWKRWKVAPMPLNSLLIADSSASAMPFSHACKQIHVPWHLCTYTVFSLQGGWTLWLTLTEYSRNDSISLLKSGYRKTLASILGTFYEVIHSEGHERHVNNPGESPNSVSLTVDPAVTVKPWDDCHPGQMLDDNLWETLIQRHPVKLGTDSSLTGIVKK